MSSIKISGGSSVFGEVGISGDTESAISLICFHLINKTDAAVVLSNIPRSNLFLDYCKFLEEIGCEIKWLSESSIEFNAQSDLSNNLKKISKKLYPNLLLILIPVVLSRHKECIVSKSANKDLKFFMSMGLEISMTGVSFVLRKNDFVGIRQIKDDPELGFYQSLSYVLIDKQRPSSDDNLENKRYRDKRIDMLANIPLKAGDEYFRAKVNNEEFNMYSMLPLITDGEINIRGFDIVDTLDILMDIDAIGGSYEVKGNEVRIWRDAKPMQESYDWLHKPVDHIAYFLLFFSLSNDKNIMIRTKKNDQLSQLIKEINMAGGKINTKNHGAVLKIEISPTNAFNARKLSVVDTLDGGVKVALAAISSSVTKIDNFGVVLDRFPYLLDNLKGINLDFRV